MDSEGQLSELQAQAQLQLLSLQSLLAGEAVDDETLIALWKIGSLIKAFDHQLRALRGAIQVPSIQQVVDWRLRVLDEQREQGSDSVPAAETDTQTIAVPDNLARIPAGEFLMGDPSDQGDDDERPQHSVLVSEFFMEKTLVTGKLWREVRGWAVKHGYEFSEGSSEGGGHPIVNVSWFDAVKWCNARSERDGLEPCYFQIANHTDVFRGGQSELSAEMVDWEASGYRLPTEAEWEKAARGGLVGQHYRWESPAEKRYDKVFSSKRANNGAGTTPVGKYEANGFGLLDMVGNISGNGVGIASSMKAGTKMTQQNSWTRAAQATRATVLFAAAALPMTRGTCGARTASGYASSSQGFRVVRGRIKPGGERSEEGDEGSGEGRARPEELSERSERAKFFQRILNKLGISNSNRR